MSNRQAFIIAVRHALKHYASVHIMTGDAHEGDLSSGSGISSTCYWRTLPGMAWQMLPCISQMQPFMFRESLQMCCCPLRHTYIGQTTLQEASHLAVSCMQQTTQPRQTRPPFQGLAQTLFSREWGSAPRSGRPGCAHSAAPPRSLPGTCRCPGALAGEAAWAEARLHGRPLKPISRACTSAISHDP